MKKENGITLIPVVITVIVLLILAGVSIGVIGQNENSIIDKALETKNNFETEYNNQKAEEAIVGNMILDESI